MLFRSLIFELNKIKRLISINYKLFCHILLQMFRMDFKDLQIQNKNFISYKFLNSLFMGVSIGSIFTIYNPLEPSVYSIGGIALALGMILVATQYHKILTVKYFYRISLLVELIILGVIISFLIFSYKFIILV